MLEITSLIGYFDLDPNRVAALVLDIFQDQWDNGAYLRLLPLFSQQAVTASLAFIYAHYQVALAMTGTEPLAMADCCYRHTSLQALLYCWQTAPKALLKPMSLACQKSSDHLELLICCTYDIWRPVPACMGLSIILSLIFHPLPVGLVRG